MKKPIQLENIDFEKIRSICQDYVDFIDDDENYHEDNEYKHFIFEEAMETVFGKDVWYYINNRR